MVYSSFNLGHITQIHPLSTWKNDEIMAFFVFIFLQSELEDGVRENQVRFGEKKNSE